MNTYFTKEEKGNKALLFLHGWGCDGAIFKSIATHLNCTSYLIDIWGFGNSDTPPTAWDVVDYARQLKTFCDEQGLTRFSIVAHSFGARVAIVFASKYPQMVENLLICGGAGLKRANIKRWLRVVRYKLAKTLSKFGVNCRIPQGSADYQALDGVMKATFVKVVNQDLSCFAKCVSCPTLLVWGKRDTETPLWMGKRYNRLIDNSALVTLDGGHFVFCEQQRQFLLIAQSFLGIN